MRFVTIVSSYLFLHVSGIRLIVLFDLRYVVQKYPQSIIFFRHHHLNGSIDQSVNRFYDTSWVKTNTSNMMHPLAEARRPTRMQLTPVVFPSRRGRATKIVLASSPRIAFSAYPKSPPCQSRSLQNRAPQKNLHDGTGNHLRGDIRRG
jgi:hypothetical protein